MLDVGANRGQYAQHLRRLGFKGFVFSFEPNPAVFQTLQQEPGDDPMWKGYNLALGSEDTSLVLHIREISELSSFLDLSNAGTKEVVVERVPVRRLDGLADGILAPVTNPRVFLKMDTGVRLRGAEGRRGRAGRRRGPAVRDLRSR